MGGWIDRWITDDWRVGWLNRYMDGQTDVGQMKAGGN